MSNDMTPFGGDDKPTMSSREIADICEARHNDVVATIERLFAKGVLRESRKTTRTYSPPAGGRPTEVYDLTKRDSLVVVSGYDDLIRAKLIDRWIELETKDQPDPVAMLNDPAAMRVLLLGYTEKVIALEAEIAAVQPRLEALDRISESDGSFCVTDAAKTLQARPKDLFAFLRGRRWIYSRAGGGEIAYQDKLQSGLLEHKTTTVHRTDGSEKVVTQVRVTPKGLTILAQHFGGH